MELLAEGPTAEVFADGKGLVLKLDRPDWNGLSAFGGAVLIDLADAGLPVARSRGTSSRRTRGAGRREDIFETIPELVDSSGNTPRC